MCIRDRFWYPEEESLPPQIDAPLQEYLTNSATRSMVVVPVFDKAESTEMQLDSHREKRKLIGGIIVEHCREQWDREQKAPVVELATRHGSDAFRNSWNHQSLFLYSVWKWIGKSKIVLATRHLPKTIAVCLGLLALGLILTFAQTDFQLSCDGSLIPEQSAFVFPKRPGVVTEVLVGHGQKVEKGEKILQLTDLDLEYQLTEIEGRIGEVKTSVRAIESRRLGRNRDDDESLQQENLVAQKMELNSLKEQRRIFVQRQEALAITSPLAGNVMTWEVRKRLQNRPVGVVDQLLDCLLYTSPSPRDRTRSRMPSSA